MTNPIDEYAKTLATSWAVIIVLAAVVGGVGGMALQSGSDGGPDSSVAVVTLDSVSITGSSADTTAKELRDVRMNDSIEAVVLRVSSPGGSVTGSEVQYRAVKRLAAEKPVVASVRNYAASGGYYSALPADKIYASPASLVGSVGVLATVTENERAPSQWKSAPDKGTAGPADASRARAATFRESFLNAVMNERGDALEVDRETVGEAKLYAGNRAVELGFADEIGDTETAIQDAANRADLSDYDVTYRNPGAGSGLLTLLGSADSGGDAAVEDAYAAPGLCGQDYLAYAPQAGPDLEVILNASC